MDNPRDKFANLYRNLYAISGIIVIIMVFAFFYWIQHIPIMSKKMRHGLLTNCIASCMYYKNKSGVIDLKRPKTDEKNVDRCINLCREKYRK